MNLCKKSFIELSCAWTGVIIDKRSNGYIEKYIEWLYRAYKFVLEEFRMYGCVCPQSIINMHANKKIN